MPRSRARIVGLALTLTATVGAAGITGLAVAATAKPPAVRTVTASGTALKFSAAKLAAPAGPVRLVLRNRSSLSHNIALRGKRLPKAKLGTVVGPGGTSRVAFPNLRPGTYRYFCSVGGHESAGMFGALTVRR